MRPKTALALGLAGLATAGLGAVLPAGAEVRTFEITLVNGSVVTVSVDVPPGTEAWDIAFPGVVDEEITAISEVPTPAPVAPPADPGASSGPAPPPAGAPAGPVDDASAQTPPRSLGDAEAEADQSAAADEPRVREGGRRQSTTGRAERAARDEQGRLVEGGADAGDGARSRATGEAGMPTSANPTTSIAVPGAAPIGVPNFFIDKFRIPPFLLSIYQAAGIEYGIRWELLAAINEIETDYGRNLNVSSAGALGWMQFMPATWKAYGVDANGDKRKDPYNPVDAIFAAARYLKAAGAETDLRKAVFAYNHADWYVDSVLMRARLIGGLPTNLVSSLTGLTQGLFPVDARARYADDLDEREATRRVAKGRNASIPVAGSATRRGLNVYAKPGAPVVAVQDGKVVRMGRTKRLGRFVQLRDAFGNTYTYAHLGSLAERHPVPEDPGAELARTVEPRRDPAPSQAASAGTQRRDRPTTAKAGGPKLPRWQGEKERVFANPDRPSALPHGGREQLDVAASPADLRLLRLPASEVTMKPLKAGSRVVGGTVLGRIGRTSRAVSPHLLFEIRPAGRGAPRIDPKPILDGWKLLESSAVYRAEGRNPFFGRDARTPTIGQILLMGKAELETRVLRNPRIEIYGCGRRDVRGSRIDRRVLATLEFLAANGLRPTATSLQCGHSTYTASGNVSHHSTGNAVDIAKLNGIPVLGHQGKGSVTDIAVRRLLTLQGTMRPSQIITLMKYEAADNTLAMGDHHDHIHIGFAPMVGANTRAGRQLNAVLRPGQWIKLVDRLGQIDNPTVRLTPSTAAITVRPGRASRRHRGE